ncbi:hypothetical protein EGW08_021696 [Elysia chlorotica]|uniref:Uncharacterized protein n=1 Tax=Elysia chlorotica TaxID=188477 RepID=A0A3S1B2U0_ELYCH|nr:hypothetical protein EGW08_021696 [Elysia chlorotica]
MADEENDVKQINDKVLCVHDENVVDDLSKAEVTENKKDTKEDVTEVKSDEKKETDTKEEKVEKKIEDEQDNDGEEDEEEDDEESETLPPGLLEQPLEVEGKRQKRKVERLSATMIRSPPEKPQMEIEEGKGTKLGDIPYVTHHINITKASDLRNLHKLLFLRACSMHDTKKNIRKFSGITEAKDSKEREKRMTIANKMSLMELKNTCFWFGVRHIGTKTELIDRIMSFLEKPEDQGAEIKKRRTRTKSAKPKGTKRKRKTKNTTKEDKPKKKAKKSKGAESEKKEEDDDEENMSEEEEEEEIEESEEEDDNDEDYSEEEAPKKKKPKLEVKKKEKKTPKKNAKENGKKEKASPKKKSTPSKAKSPKKETNKKAPPKKEEELADSLSSDSDSEDEPLIATPKPPSNDEIKKLVKSILDGADLETVTMKTVVKQVYAKYPKFDLSDRKDFIKSTVREVIS